MSEQFNITIIREALDGIRGDDQRRIATVGLAWVETLLRKNADYGSSAWQVPVMCPKLSASDAILVRMSDKIQRILALMNKPAEVVSESLHDTFSDLGAYCLLYVAQPIDN